MTARDPRQARAAIEARNRVLEQRAGTDRDLGSLVPAHYSRFTQIILAALLLVIAGSWIVLIL